MPCILRLSEISRRNLVVRRDCHFGKTEAAKDRTEGRDTTLTCSEGRGRNSIPIAAILGDTCRDLLISLAKRQPQAQIPQLPNPEFEKSSDRLFPRSLPLAFFEGYCESLKSPIPRDEGLSSPSRSLTICRIAG